MFKFIRFDEGFYGIFMLIYEDDEHNQFFRLIIRLLFVKRFKELFLV